MIYHILNPVFVGILGGVINILAGFSLYDPKAWAVLVILGVINMLINLTHD